MVNSGGERTDADRQQLWRLLLNYADPDDPPVRQGLTARQMANITLALEVMYEQERMRMHQSFMTLVSGIVADVAHLLCTAPVQMGLSGRSWRARTWRRRLWTRSNMKKVR